MKIIKNIIRTIKLINTRNIIYIILYEKKKFYLIIRYFPYRIRFKIYFLKIVLYSNVLFLLTTKTFKI